MRFVALLRAVNVGGHVVKMDRLRRLFEVEGLTGVETFIASGNVVFESRGRNAAAMERRIEAALARGLGYEVATFVRTMEEMGGIAAHHPPSFGELPPGATVFIGFMRAPLGAEASVRVQALATANDRFAPHGREIYWLRRVKSLESLALMARLERAVGAAVTTRNATTVRKLLQKYGPAAMTAVSKRSG